MSKSVDNLILDLLEWIGQGERPYRETMEGGERRARACRSGRPV